MTGKVGSDFMLGPFTADDIVKGSVKMAKTCHLTRF
jgi:hypothetical protein